MKLDAFESCDSRGGLAIGLRWVAWENGLMKGSLEKRVEPDLPHLGVNCSGWKTYTDNHILTLCIASQGTVDQHFTPVPFAPRQIRLFCCIHMTNRKCQFRQYAAIIISHQL